MEKKSSMSNLHILQFLVPIIICLEGAGELQVIPVTRPLIRKRIKPLTHLWKWDCTGSYASTRYNTTCPQGLL